VLEPSVIIPFGDTKDIFLTTLGQTTLEPTDRYKLKEVDVEGPAIYVNIGA
jgi:hypothetical protein